MSVCSIDGCDRPCKGRGLCTKHYQRWRKYGDTEAVFTNRIDGTPAERFWARVERGGDNECWPWTGGRAGSGYGQFWNGKRKVGVHRFAYELLIGPIPVGMVVDHTCHNGSDCAGGYACPHRLCVNPAHLEAVTHGENSLRGHNANARGAWSAHRTHCANGHALTPENVRVVVHRLCLVCARNRQREHAARWRAKQAASSSARA